MNITAPPIIAAAGFALFSIYLLVRERTANTWPTVIAKVIELPPQTMFENFRSGVWGLNTDNDYYLTWTVDGEDYRKRLKDKSSVHISGFKVWRKAPDLEDMTIRYNPKNPNDCFENEDEGAWKWTLGASTFLLLMVVLASAT